MLRKAKKKREKSQRRETRSAEERCLKEREGELDLQRKVVLRILVPSPSHVDESEDGVSDGDPFGLALFEDRGRDFGIVGDGVDVSSSFGTWRSSREGLTTLISEVKKRKEARQLREEVWGRKEGERREEGDEGESENSRSASPGCS